MRNSTQLALTFLAAAGLAACGDSGSLSDGSAASGGGTVAAGQVSTGPITAFGSIFVNGVQYDIDQALASGQVIVNGRPVASQDELGEGMKVTVVAGASLPNGQVQAQRVVYWSDLAAWDDGSGTGLPANIDLAASTFELLGRTVRVDDLTVFAVEDGAFQVTDLAGLQQAIQNKQVTGVEVSGLPDASGRILATRIEIKTTAPQGVARHTVRGIVRNWDAAAGTFDLAPAGLANAQAFLHVSLDPVAIAPQGMADGVAVEVEGRLDDAVSRRFTATEVELAEGSFEQELHRRRAGDEGDHGSGEVELTGLVSGFDAGARTFVVQGVTVHYANARTESEGGHGDEHGDDHAGSGASFPTGLGDGALVEVEGRLDAGGVLVARKVEVKRPAASGGAQAMVTVEVEGPIVGVDASARTVRVRTASGEVAVKLTATTLFRDRRATSVGVPASLNVNTAFDTASGVALLVNHRVEVYGTRDGTAEVTALRLEAKDPAG